MVDLAEHLARRGTNLEPFEVRPVKLVRRYGRQPLALDDDLGAYPFASAISIVDASQLRDHAAAVATPVLHVERAVDAVHAQQSTRRSCATLSRGSVYDCTLSHPFTPNTPLTRPRVTHFVGFALTAESQGAPNRYAALAAVARCCLSRSVTRSDG